MKKESFKDTWQLKAPKELTEAYINYKYYYGSYKNESSRFEKKNNRVFLWVAVIGLLVTFLLGLQEFLPKEVCGWVIICIKILVFILPLVSSFLLLFSNQKGYKRKEELREDARIHSKFLVNEAKLRFSFAQTDEDYKAIFKWLNDEMLKLQLSQASAYFIVHNKNANQ